MEKTPWEQAVDFHGHACPGLALGFKAAEAAIRALGQVRDTDEEIIAIVENDSCAVDAIQLILGCTAGKGNMIFRNNGKQVYTVGRRKDDKAVRISLKYETMSAAGTDETREEKMSRILNAGVDELFDIKEVSIDLPRKAAVFKSLKCARCGEGVMEPKARIRDGEPVCPDCFEDYTRGW
ncbi:MAG: formylmethanofuran dehydrogenase [Firmicutes bacterium HGW-Firmicutes-14]|nr:MAG: formylmethanofuran dehydrogenase [Firmicutes bacterium HGW-Firmicutes-14]